MTDLTPEQLEIQLEILHLMRELSPDGQRLVADLVRIIADHLSEQDYS